LLRKQQKTLGGYFFLPHSVYNCIYVVYILCSEINTFGYLLFGHKCIRLTHRLTHRPSPLQFIIVMDAVSESVQHDVPLDMLYEMI